MRKHLIIWGLLFIQLPLFAQSTVRDTAGILNFDQYLQWVSAYHPVARQISLMQQDAEAKLRKARGAFDPKLYAEYDDKLFGETNYWDLFEGGVKIPTRTGVEVKAAFNTVEGDFTNKNTKIPSQGQALIGVLVPLLRGLRIDAARASLQQAKITIQQTAVEQQLEFNDLLYKASLAYWDWANQYSAQLLFEEAAERARVRFEGVKQAYFAGDEAAIDTTDALTQYQSIQLLLLEAQNNFVVAGFNLSNFLWSDQGLPLQLNAGVFPFNLLEDELAAVFTPFQTDSMISQVNMHPALLDNVYKLQKLVIERKLKSEMLKPQVDVNYNILSSDQGFHEGSIQPDFLPTQNYKWGFEVGFPIFLRKERGDLQSTKVKIQQTELEGDKKRLEIQNKLLYYQNTSNALRNQIDLQRINVLNYVRLLEGEEEMFRNGQSNLFRINNREMKLIDARQKLLSLQQKFAKTQASWRLAAASLQMP